VPPKRARIVDYAQGIPWCRLNFVGRIRVLKLVVVVAFSSRAASKALVERVSADGIKPLKLSVGQSSLSVQAREASVSH